MMFKVGITERGDGGLEIEKVLDALYEEQVDAAIIITKNPTLLLAHDLPPNTIIHCTITGFGGTTVELKVPNSKITLPAYEELVKKYGGERVVLRVDPIFDDVRSITFAKHAAKRAIGRFRISFFDAYPHSKMRLGKWSHLFKTQPHFHLPTTRRIEILKELEKLRTTSMLGFKKGVEICGEPGMVCTGCVSERDLAAMNLMPQFRDFKAKAGQREACECLAIKTELLTEAKPCEFGCLYCYWKDKRELKER